MARNNPVLLTGPTRGLDGRSVLAKARAPLITDGRIGDFWIDTVSKKLYGPKNAAEWPDNGLIKGDKGWTPVFATVTDGTRRVQQIVDWTGGEGTKPAVGQYVGADGLVDDIENAVDFRGPEGPQALINALDPASVALADDTLIATGAPAEDNVKRQASEVFDLGGVIDRKSKAHAEASTVSRLIKRMRVQFYAPNYADLSTLVGGFNCFRVNEEPTHPGKIRTADRWNAEQVHDSANGGWWEYERDSVGNPCRFGAIGVANFDSYAAIQKCFDFMIDGDAFTLPQGDFAVSAKLKFNKHRATFETIGRIIPHGSYSGFLIEFVEETPNGDSINVGQMIDLKSLNIDGLWQSRGARLDKQYCSKRSNIHITRAYGTALDLDEGYECTYTGVTLNLCKNRTRFDVPESWNSATPYAVGDRIVFQYAAYDPAVSYSAGSLVRSSGVSYISLKSGNQGNDPAASTFWFRIEDPYFECMIAHTNKSPLDPAVYTTNNGVAANRYWKFVLRDEPVLNIEHTHADGVVDHQYFYGLDVRDNACRNLIYIDNNGNSRSVYAIEFYGAQVHAIIPGVIADARNTGGMAMPTRLRNVILGRTVDCKFIGGSFRSAQIDDSVSITYGLDVPGKVSYGLHHIGRLDGEGARSAGILVGAAAAAAISLDHFIDPFYVMAGAGARNAADPFGVVRRNVKAPLVAPNVGNLGTSLRLSVNQAIPHDVETAITWATIDNDVHGMFSPGSPARITCNFKGAIEISVNLSWGASAGGYRLVRLWKNGSPTLRQGFEIADAAIGTSVGNRQNGKSGPLICEVGDYFEVRVRQTAGAPVDLVAGGSTWLQAFRLY